jgi:hypothetical protein
MQPKQLAIVVATVLAVGGIGVVLVGRDAAPSLPEIRDHEAADAAIEQLLRLDARFEAGISLMGYSEGLADVLYAVDAFYASGEAASMPGVAASIGEARAHYQWVARIWPMKLGKLTRNTLEVPNEEDSGRYFGPNEEASRAAVQGVRDWAMATGDLENYIDQLVARVLTRAGDLAREARKELQAITAGT